MAINTNSYFSNSLPSGEMSVGAGIDLFSEVANPKFAIGTKVQRADGNVYRYAQFGAITSAGFVVAPKMKESAQAYSANAIIATSSAFQQPTETTGVYPSMLGSKYVVAQIGTKTADQFAGGYFGVVSGTGIGNTYRIKGNKASNGTATTIELYDTIVKGLDTTSDITIAPSKYANLEAATADVTTDTALPVGVTLVDIGTDGSYGWVLTKGITGVRQGLNILPGIMAVLSSDNAGRVASFGCGASTAPTTSQIDIPIIGVCVQDSATSAHALIDVGLE